MGKKFEPSLLLHRPLMANLATVSRDGSPRNAPMWFIWESNKLWLLSSINSSSLNRLKINPNCAVEIVDFNPNEGILLHLGLRGSATITPMDVNRFERLLAKYLGKKANWNKWFIKNIARIDDPEGRMICLASESIFSNNVSYFKTGPEFAWPIK